MNTRIELAALGCLAMALAAPCAAQSVRVNVPFEFQAAGRLLPAGEYTVTVDVAPRRMVLMNRTRLVKPSGCDAG